MYAIMLQVHGVVDGERLQTLQRALEKIMSVEGVRVHEKLGKLDVSTALQILTESMLVLYISLQHRCIIWLICEAQILKWASNCRLNTVPSQAAPAIFCELHKSLVMKQKFILTHCQMA